MKVAIVDDEALERKALCKMINNHLPDIEVVAEGANGREAIDIAKQYCPDVMLIDIKMPGLDGLQAIEAIRQDGLDLEFIIVSAFDLFDYAKQAMRFGVKEYILKPSRKEEVISALERIGQDVAAKRRHAEQMRWLQTLMESEWLSVLMTEDVSADEWERWQELLPFSIASGMFLVIQFPDAGVTDEWKSWLDKQLSGKAPTRYWIGRMANRRLPVLLFRSPNDGEPAWKPIIQALALDLARQFSARYGAALYIGLGSPFSRLDQLRSSYYERCRPLIITPTGKKRKSAFCRRKRRAPAGKRNGINSCLKRCALATSSKPDDLSDVYRGTGLFSFTVGRRSQSGRDLCVARASSIGAGHSL
ncbi:Transcriptional regulatory protein DegU [Geobacillus sp. BCO2]|nr:Transcriptional regulatory protein DegU [Geobacillus sp. BCO2]